MLSFFGFCTIIVLLILVMTKRTSVIVALVGVPVIFGALAGFTPKLGEFASKGITSVTPTAVMLTFAILYFGVMNDVGMFDPIFKKVIKFSGNDPAKIAVGSAILAITTHLDGSGASTFMISIPLLLPLYDKIGMDRKILAATVALGAGTMNMVPWGGPTLRAATSLKLDMGDFFSPMVPVLGAGLLTVLAISYWLGKKERVRLGWIKNQDNKTVLVETVSEEAKGNELKRPKLVWFNMILTLLAIIALVKTILPLPVVFLVALVIALVVNYPNVKMQQDRITAHGKTAILMVAIIFAAGVFTGILTHSGMIKEMTLALVAIIPQSIGGHLPIITALTSVPASLLFDPDSYYFGVLPVLASVSAAMGVPGVEVARAAIVGQMTVGFPISPLTASTFLLIGLTGIDLGDHQKRTIPLALAVTFIMTVTAVLLGAFRF